MGVKAQAVVKPLRRGDVYDVDSRSFRKARGDKERGLSRSGKWLLWLLADYHNDSTLQCDPAIGSLADCGLLTERAVELTLKELAGGDFIRIENRKSERHAGNRTNQYWLICVDGAEVAAHLEPLDYVGGEESSPPPGEAFSPPGAKGFQEGGRKDFTPGAKDVHPGGEGIDPQTITEPSSSADGADDSETLIEPPTQPTRESIAAPPRERTVIAANVAASSESGDRASELFDQVSISATERRFASIFVKQYSGPQRTDLEVDIPTDGGEVIVKIRRDALAGDEALSKALAAAAKAIGRHIRVVDAEAA